MRVRGWWLVLLLVLSARTAAATPILSVQPVTGTVGVGDSFFVDIVATGVTDLFGFQFDLGFDPAVLAAFDVTEGAFLPSAGSTFFIPGFIDNVTGAITFTAGSLLGFVPGATGSGVLASIGFTAIGVGASPLSLSNVLLQDSSFAFIDATISDATVQSAPEPSTVLLVGTGVATLWRRRRRTRTT